MNKKKNAFYDERQAKARKRRKYQRRRKPKRQGSRNQQGKRLPEWQRYCRPFWSHQPHHHRKDG